MRIGRQVNLPGWPVVLLMPWLALAGVDAMPEQDERKRVRVVGVVGKWTEERRDGEAVIAGDGPAAGAPAASDATTAATAIFGRADDGFVANATAPSAFSLAVLPQLGELAEGTYRAAFKMVSGESDQTAGLVFDLKPGGEYLFVRYNTKEGNVALWRYAAGQREVVARSDAKQQLPLNVWHDLVVTIAGTRITGTAGSGLRLEHDLGRPVSGRIGFWTKRDSVTLFKDAVVRGTR